MSEFADLSEMLAIEILIRSPNGPKGRISSFAPYSRRDDTDPSNSPLGKHHSAISNLPELGSDSAGREQPAGGTT
jgi:hypothetical protein